MVEWGLTPVGKVSKQFGTLVFFVSVNRTDYTLY